MFLHSTVSFESSDNRIDNTNHNNNDNDKRNRKNRQILGHFQTTEKGVQHEDQIIQIVVGVLGMVPNNLENRSNWKSGGESWLSRLQVYWDRPKYSEDVWRPEETCSHSNSRERSWANGRRKTYKKRICKIVDFAVPGNHRIKLKECEKKYKYLELTRGLKKTMEHEGNICTNRDWRFWYSN